MDDLPRSPKCVHCFSSPGFRQYASGVLPSFTLSIFLGSSPNLLRHKVGPPTNLLTQMLGSPHFRRGSLVPQLQGEIPPVLRLGLSFWSLEFSRESQFPTPTQPPLGPHFGTLVLSPANQAALTCVPGLWALFPAPPRSLQLPQSRVPRALVLGLSASPTKSPELLGVGKFLLCSPNTLGPAACPPGRRQCFSRVQENDWALPPVSPKFGHCPRVFQRTGRCPRTLGTAPGVSLTFSASAARCRALALCLGS